MASRAIVRRNIISDYLSVYARSARSSSSQSNRPPVDVRESFRRDGSLEIVPSLSTKESEDLLSRLSTEGSLSALKKGREIHGYLLGKGFRLEGSIAVALVDMYGCCVDFSSAQAVFDGMEKKGTEDFVFASSVFARMTVVQRMKNLIRQSEYHSQYEEEHGPVSWIHANGKLTPFQANDKSLPKKMKMKVYSMLSLMNAEAARTGIISIPMDPTGRCMWRLHASDLEAFDDR
ncbi:unnamed protein product [Microthlaspi erraticum]|uniref:DYW domain-containing protein n=1 Tax=Microthlaspi erraticum TaxID=1685480 RepID=A0A6D2K5N1_9BRAS|nr:unnamed protein product [Microthlaspi erraticum]